MLIMLFLLCFIVLLLVFPPVSPPLKTLLVGKIVLVSSEKILFFGKESGVLSKIIKNPQKRFKFEVRRLRRRKPHLLRN